MKNPNPLMLLRIAQGDAYCHGVEYVKDPAIVADALKFERYVKHPTHSLDAGQYTDDTQMSIAVAGVLLTEKDRHLAKVPSTVREMDDLRVAFVESFIDCFRRDPRDGYARGFQAFLESVVDARDFLRRINPDSDKNGAAMRSVPLGVLPTTALVEYAAGEQAKITHHTSGGVGSSMLTALLSHFALYHDAPLSEGREFLRAHFHMREDEEDIAPWPGGPVAGPGVGMKTFRAVMTLVSTETSLIGVAHKAIEWGGDVDSVLSIAWGIASTRMQGDDLPPFFEGGLEDGTYGRDFLRDLGQKLMEAYHVV